jgi:hypothetical protein
MKLFVIPNSRCHDIAEILLKLALNTNKSVNQLNSSVDSKNMFLGFKCKICVNIKVF